MSIAKQAARGVAWNMVLGISSRMLQLIGTLLLAKYIVPHDYGAVMAASIAVMVAGAFTSFAFGQYLIAKRASPEVAIQAAILHVGLGVITMAVLYLLSEPIGNLLDSPAMDQYVLGLAAAHLIDRARYVPERLIMRSLRFRALATINGLGEISFTVAALATVHVWGPSAIVIGTLARSVVTSSLFFYAAPRAEWFVRARLRAADVRDLFLYGLPILIANISDRAATRCDNFIVTKLFGLDVMARYQLSFSLAEMPIFNVAEHIGEVLMPSFSRMEPAQRERAVVRAPGLMGLIVSPLGVGLGAVAPTVVATFFNARWGGPEMGSMLRILSIMTVFRPMTWSAIAYAQAVQKPRLVMISSFSRAIVVLPLIAMFGYVGGSADWACIGAGIGYAFHAVFTIVATGSVTDMATGAYLRGIVRPLLPCIPMFFVVELVEHAISAPTDNHVLLVASLAAQILSGAIIYVGAAFVLVRPSVDELLRIGRESIRRRR